MLQAIRTRAGSIIVKVLFGLLIISFGFWGIYTRSPFYQDNSPEAVVATVGDQEIHAAELQRAVQTSLERLRQQFGGTIDPQQIKQLGIADMLLGQLVDRTLLDEEARRLQLDVSDDIVRAAIYENPAFKGPDGRFDRNLFNQVLTMNQMNEEQLIARLRRDIPRADLLQAVTAGASGPQPVIAAIYRFRNEKRIADIVAFPIAAIGDVGQPGDDELNKFYEAHQDLFRAPEFRGFTAITLDASQVAKGIEIPEDQLRKEYESRKEEFATPEQREVQQILAPSEEKAKEAEQQLAAGKDWKEIAISLGQDPETIDLGLLKRQEMPKQLADIAFELPVNTPSDPVKSPLGWHILRVTKIEPPTEQNFEQVKAQLATEMAREEALDRLDKLSNKIDDALAGGKPLADVAAEFGMTVTKIAASDAGGRDPEGKPISLAAAGNEVLKTAFDTEANQTSRVLGTQEGAIFAVHVDKVTPPAVRPLSEVKDRAVTAWQSEQKHKKVAQQAEELAAAVKPEAQLAAVAQSKGLTATTSPPLGRRPEQGASASPGLVAKLFSAKQGDVVTAEDANGAYVAQLKEIQSPKDVPDNVTAALGNDLAGAMRVDIASELSQALKRRFPVEIKRETVDKMF